MVDTPESAKFHAIDPVATDKVVADIIHDCETYDDLASKMKEGGVFLEKILNNFPNRLSSPQGYAINVALQLAKMSKQTTVNVEKLTPAEACEEMERLLIMNMDASVATAARKELSLRELAQLVQKAGIRPEYCQVGNPELKKKYDEADPAARQFVFDCAKLLLLKGMRFYEDIWK